jgi:MATE family multidrug resistance protein
VRPVADDAPPDEPAGDSGSFLRLADAVDLVRLALPVAATRASFILMGLTDAIVLGRNRPGELPFVLNAWLPLGIAMGFGIGLLTGVQVLTAELSGAGRAGETGRILRRGLAVGVGFGLAAMVACAVVARPLIAAFGFDEHVVASTATCTRILAYGLPLQMIFAATASSLEALRRPGLVTAISWGAVLLNAWLDIAWVPAHGAAGVAWATTLSRGAMAVAGLVAVAVFTPLFTVAGRADRGEFARQNRLGYGAALANVAEWGSFNLTHVFASLVSLDAGTVWGIAVQVLGAVFMIAVGLGSATAVRVAEHRGRGDSPGAARAARLGMTVSLLIGVLLAAAIWTGRHWLARHWLDAEGTADGARLAPLLAAMLAATAPVTIFDGVQGVASMALRAAGVVWAPTAIHAASYVAVMVPLCWWLAFPLGLGLWGVVIGVAIASILAGVLQAVLLEWVLRRGG